MSALNITLNVGLAHAIIGATAASSSASKSVSIPANTKISQTGSRVAGGVASVGTSPAALDIAQLGGGTLGWFCIKNLDITNNLTLLTQVSSGVAIITLLPGECASGRFGSGITAPAVESSASTVAYEYLVCEA